MQPSVFSEFITLVCSVGVTHRMDIDRDLKEMYLHTNNLQANCTQGSR